MKKNVYVKLKMFGDSLIVYTDEEGIQMEAAAPISKISDVILNYVKEFDVTNIELQGAKSFAMGIKKDIEKRNKTLYNHRELNITIK